MSLLQAVPISLPCAVRSIAERLTGSACSAAEAAASPQPIHYGDREAMALPRSPALLTTIQSCLSFTQTGFQELHNTFIKK
uniref:Uncharacterized protein n=1 Tax=Oryza rufipogon TaxID=4529 RepID=A0A0E0Q6X0_ORYRU